jgi:hypothetical protein
LAARACEAGEAARRAPPLRRIPGTRRDYRRGEGVVKASAEHKRNLFSVILRRNEIGEHEQAVGFEDPFDFAQRDERIEEVRNRESGDDTIKGSRRERGGEQNHGRLRPGPLRLAEESRFEARLGICV